MLNTTKSQSVYYLNVSLGLVNCVDAFRMIKLLINNRPWFKLQSFTENLEWLYNTSTLNIVLQHSIPQQSTGKIMAETGVSTLELYTPLNQLRCKMAFTSILGPWRGLRALLCHWFFHPEGLSQLCKLFHFLTSITNMGEGRDQLTNSFHLQPVLHGIKGSVLSIISFLNTQSALVSQQQRIHHANSSTHHPCLFPWQSELRFFIPVSLFNQKLFHVLCPSETEPFAIAFWSRSCRDARHKQQAPSMIRQTDGWLPRVPLDLLLVVEHWEACTDTSGEPGADAVKQALKGEEAGHRDARYQRAEGIHEQPMLKRGALKRNVQKP